MRWWLSGLLLVVVPAFGQTGRLAYVKDGAVLVEPADGSAPAVALPRSRGVNAFSLRPSDGSVWYTIALTPGSPETGWAGLVSAPPYTAAGELAEPLREKGFAHALWTPAGDRAHLFVDGARYLWRPEGGLTAVEFDAESLSADGRFAAYRTEKEIRVRDLVGGADRSLASMGRPQPLFDALARAAAPRQVEDLRRSIEPSLYKDQYNWGFGPPTVSTDGRRVWFACNFGTSLGASGNTQYCLVAADIATGQLAVLSRLGTFYGRLPDCQLASPDGGRLLLLTSFHDSAVRNPCQAYVVDLPTQAKRELLWADKQLQANPELVNLTAGACWSPDGQHLAVSVYYYDAEKLLKTLPDDLSDFDIAPAERFQLQLRTATGRLVRTIQGAQWPSWER